MENNHENFDSENEDNVNVSDSQEQETTDAVDYKALYDAEKSKNAKLFARLKKGDHSKQITQETKPAESSFSREEAFLIAKGFSEEDLDDAKFVATRFGKSLKDAAEMSQFKAMKAARLQEAEEQAAALRASQGSKTTQKATFATAADDDEHKKLFKEKYAR